MIKKVKIDCELQYIANSNSDFIFNVQASDHPWQKINNEHLTFLPEYPYTLGTNHLGNNKLLRVSNVNGSISIRYQADVDISYPPPTGNEIEHAISDIPLEITPYIWSSRYCESDAIANQALQLFGNIPSGYKRVEAIVNWVHQNVQYQAGTSNAITSTMNVLQSRVGVCRDFAHLCISFCRALNIPARFVTGYAMFDSPPNDFHAIFEAYLGGRWILFDPTQLSPLDTIVRIATGRDASDTAFSNMYGNVSMVYMNPSITEKTESLNAKN
jgi:transglutaminase-like putative cysteine protease